MRNLTAEPHANARHHHATLAPPDVALKRGVHVWRRVAPLAARRYTKLSFAYVANSVLIPAAVGALVSIESCEHGYFGCPLIQQSWYEPGGVVASIVTLIVSTGFINAFVVAFPADILFKRYVLARFAVSRAKIKLLWLPREMKLGDLYARLTALLAIGPSDASIPEPQRPPNKPQP